MQAFPHHENEIAQSRAACCDCDHEEGQERFARFWLHNGFVKINEEKMYDPFRKFWQDMQDICMSLCPAIRPELDNCFCNNCACHALWASPLQYSICP